MCRLALALLLLPACFHVQYIAQAGFGQLDLITAARDVDDVIRDPDTDERTRMLLEEVGSIAAFARERGLDTGGSYRKYVELERDQVVWFIAASRELSFDPKVWAFPVVGSFPYLGWFAGRDAVALRTALEADGWDVLVRPVRAYSTGGWFDDPVLSTMFLDGDDAVRYLANIIIHELVHANVLIADQSTFNESVASFVGDTMAADYLSARFGADSPEVAVYREELAEDQRVSELLFAAYKQLEELYASDATDGAKRAGKTRVLSALDAEVRLRWPPNNALLVGFKTYNAGRPELAQLFEGCGRDWRRLLATLSSLPTSAFGQEQQDDIGPVIAKLTCVSSVALRPDGPARLPRHRPRAARPVAARHGPGSSRRALLRSP